MYQTSNLRFEFCEIKIIVEKENDGNYSKWLRAEELCEILGVKKKQQRKMAKNPKKFGIKKFGIEHEFFVEGQYLIPEENIGVFLNKINTEKLHDGGIRRLNILKESLADLVSSLDCLWFNPVVEPLINYNHENLTTFQKDSILSYFEPRENIISNLDNYIDRIHTEMVEAKKRYDSGCVDSGDEFSNLRHRLAEQTIIRQALKPY